MSEPVIIDDEDHFVMNYGTVTGPDAANPFNESANQLPTVEIEALKARAAVVRR